MDHCFVTIVAPIARERESEVRATLDSLGNPLRAPYSGTIDEIARFHFFSLTVVEGDSEIVPHLVFEFSADGESGTALAVLAQKAESFLAPLFAMAEDSPNEKLSAPDLEKYWRTHQVKTGFGYFDTPGVGHTGTPGMSVARILSESAFADKARAAFEKTPRSPSALDMLEHVRADLRTDPENLWAFTPEPAPFLTGEKPAGLIGGIAKEWFGFVRAFLWPFVISGFLCALVMASPVDSPEGSGILAELMCLASFLMTGLGLSALFSLIFGGLVYLALRRLENADQPDDSPPDHDRLSAVRAREDFAYQNHLAGVSIMKPGLVRQITLRLIFWLIAALAKNTYRPGFLGSIGTIHFARWVMLPKTNRLLFFSNYGGSWESYLEDFINKANFGLTGVWSNTRGFPRTNNLLLGGASDGDRFKRWARRQQYPTWCWYSAYPALTTERIRIHAAIRQGLAGISTETEARDWLSLMGSAPLPRTEIESENVQGILFGGFGPLPHAACLAVRLPEDLSSARAWLNAIAPHVTFGDHKPGHESALVLGLSVSGLRKLGLSAEEIAAFPHAFVSGMAQRSRILADQGAGAPENWAWGNDHNAVDATMLLYAPTPERLAERVDSETTALAGYGGIVGYHIPLQDLPPRGTPFREPFGFVDGVSQPVIRGIGRHKPGMRDQHILEPGEFILGYPDGLGTYPQTPLVPAINDPANDLYAAPEHWPDQRPDFSNSLVPTSRDLGKDGSYMVVRQLEQDVEGFESFTQKAAKAFREGYLGKTLEGIRIDAHWIGAKLIGRWKDGSSLIRSPYQPASESNPAARPDNDFLFGKEDPQGMRCPFGAHIRRTNPRESLDPKSRDQLAITNRHRILRAGRAYETPDGKRGLLFVCLNGDLERQFEFTQQTWMNAPTFHGLPNETDPVANDSAGSRTFTIPTPEGSRTVTGMQSFVTMRGGAYLFIPGRRTLAFLGRER